MKNETVLVATWRDGLLFIRDGDVRHEFSGRAVRWIAPDGRGGALVVVDSKLLYARSAAGEWTRLAASEADISCCVAVGQTIYVGTDDARVLRWNDGSGELEALEGFARVPGRATWFAGSAVIDGKRVGPPLGIRSLAANAAGNVLLANVHVGGIPRSTDGGSSWLPTIDIHSDVHEVCAHPTRAEVVVAAAAAGVCLSWDAGETWTIDTVGLDTRHCYSVSIAGEDVFVSAAESPFASRGRVYRRPLRPDGAIEAAGGGLPPWTDGKVDTHCIAANGSALAIVDTGGNLYGSNDFGRNWSLVRTGLASPSSLLLC